MNTFWGEEGPLWVSLLQVPHPLPRVAREALLCPKSASGEQRVEGWGSVPGLSGLWPCGGKVMGSERLLAGS